MRWKKVVAAPNLTSKQFAIAVAGKGGSAAGNVEADCATKACSDADVAGDARLKRVLPNCSTPPAVAIAVEPIFASLRSRSACAPLKVMSLMNPLPAVPAVAPRSSRRLDDVGFGAGARHGAEAGDRVRQRVRGAEPLADEGASAAPAGTRGAGQSCEERGEFGGVEGRVEGLGGDCDAGGGV